MYEMQMAGQASKDEFLLRYIQNVMFVIFANYF